MDTEKKDDTFVQAIEVHPSYTWPDTLQRISDDSERGADDIPEWLALDMKGRQEVQEVLPL
jgi:hypothetical protein